MPKINSKFARDERRSEAQVRQAVRDQRSNTEQGRVLDSRLGVGKGAAKERARLFTGGSNVHKSLRRKKHQNKAEN